MPFPTIRVNYVQGRGLITVDRPRFEFDGAADVVTWVLRNLPENTFAEVNFMEEGFRGPFETLIRGSKNVLGYGKKPESGQRSYRYKISIQEWTKKGSSILAESRPLELVDNRACSRVTAQVTVDLLSTGHLVVKPEVAATCVGAPINWDFRPAIQQSTRMGLVPLRPRVLFDSGGHGSDEMGPYAGLATFESWVSGIERRDSKGAYHYDAQLEVVGRERLRVAKDVDPIIDDEGEPPQT